MDISNRDNTSASVIDGLEFDHWWDRVENYCQLAYWPEPGGIRGTWWMAAVIIQSTAVECQPGSITWKEFEVNLRCIPNKMPTGHSPKILWKSEVTICLATWKWQCFQKVLSKNDLESLHHKSIPSIQESLCVVHFKNNINKVCCIFYKKLPHSKRKSFCKSVTSQYIVHYHPIQWKNKKKTIWCRNIIVMI